jgi:hypothetical protein
MESAMKNAPWLLGMAMCVTTSIALAQSAPADDNVSNANADNAQLAEKLSNPVASLISVPLQFNYDSGIGPDQDGHKNSVNIQPVIPVQINDDWNMISRTILPVVSQSDTSPGSGSQHGIGDITQSFFFSPRAVGANGWIWGVGPVLSLPTASDPLLGSKKWGAGPTAILLRQAGGWTYGVLVNQIWSFASVSGNYSNRPPVSVMFLQPFAAFTSSTAWTYSANFESSYDWHLHQATAPLNLSISKLTRIGRQPISFAGGVRYWLASNDNGPHGWGYRFTVTLLFPQ